MKVCEIKNLLSCHYLNTKKLHAIFTFTAKPSPLDTVEKVWKMPGNKI